MERVQMGGLCQEGRDTIHKENLQSAHTQNDTADDFVVIWDRQQGDRQQGAHNAVLVTSAAGMNMKLRGG